MAKKAKRRDTVMARLAPHVRDRLLIRARQRGLSLTEVVEGLLHETDAVDGNDLDYRTLATSLLIALAQRRAPTLAALDVDVFDADRVAHLPPREAWARLSPERKRDAFAGALHEVPGPGGERLQRKFADVMVLAFTREGATFRREETQ